MHKPWKQYSFLWQSCKKRTTTSTLTPLYEGQRSIIKSLIWASHCAACPAVSWWNPTDFPFTTSTLRYVRTYEFSVWFDCDALIAVVQLYT